MLAFQTVKDFSAGGGHLSVPLLPGAVLPDAVAETAQLPRKRLFSMRGHSFPSQHRLVTFRGKQRAR